ncbi:MAG: hypothetical protein ACFCUR_20970 [Rhodomicrobiaceae bacterium]
MAEKAKNKGGRPPKDMQVPTKDLTTRMDVLMEQNKIYRAARRGKIAPDEMTRYIFALREIGATIDQLAYAELLVRFQVLQDIIERGGTLNGEAFEKFTHAIEHRGSDGEV